MNLNTCVSSRRPITRVEAKRIHEAPFSDAIDLMNQISLQDETPSKSVPTEPLRHEVMFCVNTTTTKTYNHYRFKNPFEHRPPQSPPTDFFEDSEEDTMSYPYPRYNDEPDMKAHIRAYLTTW